MGEILGWLVGFMLVFALICLGSWAPLVAYRLILRQRAERETDN